MLVKQRWSNLSEQMMYEWSMANPTAYNRKKRTHLDFWISVKNRPASSLSTVDVLRLCEIEYTHNTECKRPAFKRK